MELIQLKYFKTVAELGKISDAAQVLFVTAPAISTSIARLEKELGVRLFDHSNNRVTLNQQGQIFLRCVNQIFSNLEHTKSELHQSIKHQTKHISIATVASTQWVEMITAFSHLYTNYTLQCTSINRAQLANSGLSAQHSFLLASDDDIPLYYIDKLESTLLFEEHPVVMVHSGHPLTKYASIDLAEIASEKIFLPMRDYPLYDHLIDLFEDCSIPFPAGNAYSHLTTQHLVAQGLGIAFATQHSTCTPSAEICYIPIRNSYRPWATRLYWRKGHNLSTDEMQFKNFIEDYYRTEHLA